MSDITGLLAHIIPLSWAAAVSPVTLSIFLITISMSKNPKLAGVSFYLGALVVLLFTVIIGVFLGHRLFDTGHTDPVTIGAIDLFLGAILVLLGLKNFTSKDKGEGEGILKYLQIDPEAGFFYIFSKYFVLGLAAFLMNFSTAIFVLAAGREIGIINAGIMADSVAILLLIIIALIIIEIPLLFFIIMPNKSHKLFDPLNNWIKGHGNLVTGLFCLVIGILIVYNALQKLKII